MVSMGRTLVISDIHGCLKTFQYLLQEGLYLAKEDKLYLLGDYIDRGPDSKGVIDHIISLSQKGYQIYPIRGNHEQLLLDAYHGIPFVEKTWLKNGGARTLESFDVVQVKKIPLEYISFLSSLKNYVELENFILVHAGLNFNISNPFDDQESMLWIREYTVAPEKINDKILVQGHTPTSLENIKKSIIDRKTTYRIFLDNGCVYSSTRDDMGNLCCLNLENMNLVHCKGID
jgi:serine/threonine protein phosphatase 1